MYGFRSLLGLFSIAICIAFSGLPLASHSQTPGGFEIPGTGHFVALPIHEPESPAPELVDALTRWITGVSGLPAPARPPGIRALHGSAMAGAMGAEIAAQSQPQALSVEAFYDRANATIVLTEDWRPTPVGLSILVHELVHHLQAQAAIPQPCPAAAEALAYDVQARWLDLFGLTLGQTFAIDGLTLFVLTNCDL